MAFIIILAISLSMDAFALSLAYGTIQSNKNYILILTMIVGLFHFLMPIIGFFIGQIMIKKVLIASSIISFVILFLIGLEMILESKQNVEIKKFTNKIDLIFFALAVSIDAFSIGITLPSFSSNIFFCSFIFMCISSFFTYIGFSLGNKIANLYGKISTFISGIILIIMSFINVL